MNLNDLLVHALYHNLRLDLIAWLTYLIPNSQDFFNGFPQDKKVVIAVDNVQPVPCVFLVFIFLFLKIFNFFYLNIRPQS